MMQQKNYQYFIENLDRFIKEHGGQFVVICDCKEIGFYMTFDEAYKSTILNHELGTFIIQQCISETDSTLTFYSPLFR